MLHTTPALKSKIENISKEFINTLFSGDGVTKGNFPTDPVERTNRACLKFADDLSKAIDTFITDTTFLVQVSSLTTAGSPATHVNTSPGIIIKQ